MLEQKSTKIKNEKSLTAILFYGFSTLLIVFFILAFAIFFNKYDQSILGFTSILLIAAALLAFSNYLSIKGYYSIAKYIVIIVPPYTILIFSILAKHHLFLDNVFLFLAPRIFTLTFLLVPIVYFGVKHVKHLIISLSIIILPVVFFEYSHSFFGVGLESLTYDENYYPIFILLTSVMYFFVLISLIIFQKTGIKFRNRWAKKNEQLIIEKEGIQKLNKKLEFQAYLYDVLNITSKNEKLEVIMQNVLDLIMSSDSLTTDKKGLIFLKNEDGDLEIIARRNVDTLIKTCSLITSGQCLCGQVLESKTMLFCDSVGHNHTIIPEKMQEHGHYVIPILQEENVLGVINIYIQAGVQKDETIINYLKAIASILSRKVVSEKAKKTLIEKNHEIAYKKEQLDTTLIELNKSIEYASYLQESLIPNQKTINNYFENSSVLYLPRDLVSGDFYFAHEHEDLLYFGIGDCTGHGIPGAILASMSIEAVKFVIDKHIGDTPNNLLAELRKIASQRFKTNFAKGKSDSMDAALCLYNKKTNKLLYSGGYVDLHIINKDSEITSIKATKCPVGTYVIEREFELHEIELKKGDTIYITSDGYIDQFGTIEKNGKLRTTKFKRKRFFELIQKINNKTSQEQVQILEENFNNWKSTLEQTDDVTVMIVKH